MSPVPERALRRILVALDASETSLEALRAAAALAARMGAELEGLFVEDASLLRLAGHPFVRYLQIASGEWRPLEAADLEAELGAVAARARAALARAAAPQRVQWTFRVARGEVAVEVLAAAGSADLLVLGLAGHRLGSGPGATARQAAARAPTSVLLFRRGARLGRPLAVACDGTPSADRALDLAARIEAAGGGRLEILAVARTRAEADAVLADARRRLGRPQAPGHWPGGAGPEEVARSVDPGSVLVVGAESSLVAGEACDRLLAAAACPVLLAR